MHEKFCYIKQVDVGHFLNLAQKINETSILVFLFAETFRSFFAVAFWSLKHFGHLSHSCIKTSHNRVHSPIISDILT